MQNYYNMRFMPPCMVQSQYIMPQKTPDIMQPAQYQVPYMFNSIAGLEEYTYPENLPEALKLIQNAIYGETQDRMFYQYLISLISIVLFEEDKKIITEICNDEIRHFRICVQYRLSNECKCEIINVFSS